MNTDEYPIPSVVEKLKARDVERLISIPLRTSEGVMGAISLLYSRLMMKVRLDEDFFYFLGEQIGLVLQNAYLFRQVKQLADTDSLTGLYTRRKMRDRMEYEVRRVNRSRGQFTLAMADLDDFKHINDTHGHDCGDEVLRTAAAVMQRECRDTDSLCRWGGEEFLILFADTGPEAAAVVAERIRLAFAASEAACAPGKTITLSLGLAASNPELSLDEVISRADAALYEAKKAGKNRVVVPPAGESPS